METSTAIGALSNFNFRVLYRQRKRPARSRIDAGPFFSCAGSQNVTILNKDLDVSYQPAPKPTRPSARRSIPRPTDISLTALSSIPAVPPELVLRRPQIAPVIVDGAGWMLRLVGVEAVKWGGKTWTMLSRTRVLHLSPLAGIGRSPSEARASGEGAFHRVSRYRCAPSPGLLLRNPTSPPHAGRGDRRGDRTFISMTLPQGGMEKQGPQ